MALYPIKRKAKDGRRKLKEQALTFETLCRIRRGILGYLREQELLRSRGEGRAWMNLTTLLKDWESYEEDCPADQWDWPSLPSARAQENCGRPAADTVPAVTQAVPLSDADLAALPREVREAYLRKAAKATSSSPPPDDDDIVDKPVIAVKDVGAPGGPTVRFFSPEKISEAEEKGFEPLQPLDDEGGYQCPGAGGGVAKC